MNKQTQEWINRYSRDSCPLCNIHKSKNRDTSKLNNTYDKDSYNNNDSHGNNEYIYDVDIHIRHGDKNKEMKLISAKEYISPLFLLHHYLKQNSLLIFLNSDDIESIHYIQSHLSSQDSLVYFSSQQRYNYAFDQLYQQSNITLLSLANLYHSLYSSIHIGTFSSNWNRLLYELKLTVGNGATSMFLEVGYYSCVSYIECSLGKNHFYTDW
ncbi:hypothetical protein WA158_003770 [Blastocystis sp. Blastoise]